MKVETTFPAVMPAGVARALHTMRADIATVARKVAAARSADRAEVIVVAPVSLYCALRGLTVQRHAPRPGVSDVRDQHVAFEMRADDLHTSAALALPELTEWAGHIERRAAEAPPEHLVVAIVLSPTERGACELVIAPLTPAPAAPEAGP